MAMAKTSTHPPDSRHLGALGGLLLLCVGGGAAIGVAFSGQTAVYSGFDLPAWAPPPGLFGPVWTVLYAAMAVSGWLVWRTASTYRRRALAAFAVQLGLNFVWTPAFFGLGSPMLGLAIITAVLAAVGWWTAEAWRVRRPAGALQLPYLAWVAFATALNLAIVLGG